MTPVKPISATLRLPPAPGELPSPRWRRRRLRLGGSPRRHEFLRGNDERRLEPAEVEEIGISSDDVPRLSCYGDPDKYLVIAIVRDKDSRLDPLDRHDVDEPLVLALECEHASV